MIDQKIIDDFLRTKGDFVEQFATHFLNYLVSELEEKQKDFDRITGYRIGETELASIYACFVSYKKGFMSLRGLKDGYFEYDLFLEMYRYLMECDFEGESLPEIIKTIYKYNSGNDRGAYLEPLMEIIAAYERIYFKPIHKSLDVEFISVKKSSSFLLFEKDGEAVCRLNPAPFVKDFIEIIERKTQNISCKFEFAQRTSKSTFFEPEPLYREFRLRLPAYRKLSDESKIKSYLGEEINPYIVACLKTSKTTS